MTSEKINMFIASHSNEFDIVQIPQIKSMLERVPEKDSAMIMGMKLKNPTTVFLVSFFLGTLGVDRFMLGEIGLGVLKLSTLGGLGIWTFIDLVTISSRTKRYNFEEFMRATSVVEMSADGTV